MDREVSRIIENRQLAGGIYKMTLETKECKFARPGQFAMIGVEGKFLRRPISVCEYDSDRYTIIYKVVGEGTDILSRMLPGEKVNSITGCGNGYDVDAIPDGAYLVAGGIGIPPMLGLMKALVMQGKNANLVLGFNSKNDFFLIEEFRNICGNIDILTADGSNGRKGFVTDAFAHADYACACGPTGMLKALDSKVSRGQFSLEARMGCGFGACMGCSINTLEGPMRVCKEGPVFDKEIIEWQKL